MSIPTEETSYKFQKLNADNYYAWKFNIRMYLVGRDLWEIVAKKSKSYILNELKEDKEQCEELLSKAEEYINKL